MSPPPPPVDDWTMTDWSSGFYNYESAWDPIEYGSCLVYEFHNHSVPTVFDDICIGYSGSTNPSWKPLFDPIRNIHTVVPVTRNLLHAPGPWVVDVKHSVITMWGMNSWHNNPLDFDASRGIVLTLQDSVEFRVRPLLSSGGSGGGG